MLALAVSIIFCSVGALFCLPEETYVNGYDVSGLTKNAALSRLISSLEESLRDKELHICAGERIYTYNFPEFYYRQNFAETLKDINRAGEYRSDVYVYLNGEGEIADYICADAYIPKREPQVIFNKTGAPFTYEEEACGAEADRVKLINDIRTSLNGQFEDVHLSVKKINCRGNMLELKKQTQLLYSFTTYFDGDNAGRCANIKLAAQKINGTQVSAGQTFSFNSVVGARTAENGFNIAKIIEGGRYADGVGGGVCQVSSTLYNAAILSGLEIVEYHPHSLGVSYVAPSRDAMVSGNYFDLKFKNNKLTPIYIRMNATFGSVTCSVYGESDGWKYSFVSEIVKGEKDEKESGQNFLKSLGYVVKERNGIVKKTLVRKDRYGLRERAAEETTQNTN
jgi:vancomycin resistance protein YoaR